MRLCQFEGGVGLVEGSDFRDVSAVLHRIPAVAYPPARGDALIAALPALRSGILQLASESELRPLSSVHLKSPVRAPGKLIAAPVNYQDHLEEAISDPETFSRAHVRRIEQTGLFLKATSSLIGPGDPIRISFPERRTDHEVELAVVIGHTCRNVPRESALEVLAGYCIGLDITIRGPEERSLRKSIDSYSVLGPCLVTADELANLSGLALELDVDGEPRQRANTRDMIIDVPGLIALASRWYTLDPGDVIYTGTPAGVGPITAGNRLRASIEGIGELNMDVLGERSAV